MSGTQTDVLLNKWYAAKRLWKMTRSRGLQIMTGLKSNRHLRVADARKLQGWRRQSLKDYTTGLTKADYEQAAWPSQDAEPQPGPVHVLTTQVRKLFRCQVILVHETLDPPLAQVRFFA